MQALKDENIRTRLTEMPGHLMHNFYTGRKEEFPAQSCYVAVMHNGKTYHLFNAKRMPVGRMAVQIS